MFKNAAKRIYSRLKNVLVEEQVQYLKRALHLSGKLACFSVRDIDKVSHLSDVEFRVCSQFGEDGIIEWLVQKSNVSENTFIEFGVESYTEANTRFLLENRNWRGLIIEADAHKAALARGSDVRWRNTLEVASRFVTAENINDVISSAGFAGEIGILSIDIDGNDYWIWEAISCVSPAFVICEYNAVLGDLSPITVPYDSTFARDKKHYSFLYFGASIAALIYLAKKKGYTLLGSNSAGNNAVFVRDDRLAEFSSRISDRTARPSQIRESRDSTGKLSFLTGRERCALLEDLTFFRVDTGKTLLLRDATPLYSADWLKRMGIAN